jgi:two-component system chemotaxis response regulator CheY
MPLGKRILVVDDSTAMTAIVSRTLKDAGYGYIDCVHNGAGALSALRQKKYDLLITDWQMQPISGIELIKLIRADRDLSEIRIILITGQYLRQDDEAWLSGADGFLEKPFEPLELTEKVEDVLSTVALLGDEV